MSIASELHALTLEVLEDQCTELQADTYRRVHGVTHEGEAPPETVAAVAASRGTSKATILMQLATAESRVYRALCAHLLTRLEPAEPTRVQAREAITYLVHTELGLAATIQEAFGTHTLAEQDVEVGFTMRHPYGEHGRSAWITLGEGSERMESLGKRREDQGRRAALEQAHRTYSDHEERA